MSAAAGPGAVPDLRPGERVLAFDVGGTFIKAARIDEAGHLGEVLRIPTPPPGPGTAAAVLEVVATTAARLAGDGRPAAVGLVVPGLVDERRGVAVMSENLLWRDVPFRDAASELLGLPVAFGHDVRAAGTAEYRLGAAGAYLDVVTVVIGTGIAASIHVNGVQHAGGGAAGEVGHTRVADGPACACGLAGCLEAVASASAIARAYALATGATDVSAAEVVARAVAGEPAAGAVWTTALDALAIGLSCVSKILDPQAIVVGGGLAQAGDALFRPLTERLVAQATLSPAPVLVPARLGGDAGLAGAALLARDLAAGVVA